MRDMVQLLREAEAKVGDIHHWASGDVKKTAHGWEPLHPNKVLADVSQEVGVPSAVRTKRQRRSGLNIRKHSSRAVHVSYDDWENKNNHGEVWPKVMQALEKHGYEFHMLDGSRGEEAKKQALTSGAVIVAKPRS